MSGGVGPTCDITLQEADAPRRLSFFTLRQLNVLAIIVVLSASGMVGAGDLGFVVFSIIYMYFISRVAFPASSAQPEPPVFGEKNKILTLYVLAGAVIGLFLPIAYIFHGILEGDTEGIKAAAPHVFLLASQVFMEGVSFSRRFSLPIRVFVPVCYNSVRISSILEWLRCEIFKAETGSRRLYVGKTLALANLAFWSFNLLGFLLPFYLPKAFKIYYTRIKD